MKYPWRMAVLVVLVALVGAACSPDDAGPEPAAEPQIGSGTNTDDGDSQDSDSGPSLGMGPGISLADALTSDLSGPLLVNGFIITAADGTVYLAELLAESFPPQAGGAKLIVEGMDLSSVEGLTTAQGISWTDQPVQVLGTIDGGVLVVSATSSG